MHAAIEAAETHFLGSLYHFAAMDGVTAAHLRETILATVSMMPEVRTVGGQANIAPATSPTRVLNLRFLSYTATYDTASNICQDPRHRHAF